MERELVRAVRGRGRGRERGRGRGKQPLSRHHRLQLHPLQLHLLQCHPLQLLPLQLLAVHWHLLLLLEARLLLIQRTIPQTGHVAEEQCLHATVETAMTIVTRMMVQSVRYVSPMNLELWQQVSYFGLTATSVDAGCTTSVHLATILPAVDISAPSALTSNRAAYSLSTFLFYVCIVCCRMLPVELWLSLITSYPRIAVPPPDCDSSHLNSGSMDTHDMFMTTHNDYDNNDIMDNCSVHSTSPFFHGVKSTHFWPSIWRVNNSSCL